jgi:hypothetical protein
MMTQDFTQEQLGAFFPGLGEELVGRPFFRDAALVHKRNPVCHAPRKPQFVSYDDHGHPISREPNHDVEDFLNHFGVERRDWLIKSMIFGCIARARAIVTRCCCP